MKYQFRRHATFLCFLAAAGSCLLLPGGCKKKPSSGSRPDAGVSDAAKTPGMPAADGAGDGFNEAAGDAGEAAAPGAAAATGTPSAASTAVPTQPKVTVKAKLAQGKQPWKPRLAWTGSDFVAVWPEAAREELFWFYDDFDDEWSRWYFEDTRPRIWMVRIDESSVVKGEPVALDGAGSGPASLIGPLYSFPAWSADRLYLAWMLWNPGSKLGACRYVVGRWKPDGCPVSEPVVAGKDSFDRTAPGPLLVAAPTGIYLSWLSNLPGSETGCGRLECGPEAMSVKTVPIAEDGSPGPPDFTCGEVLVASETYRFGDGILLALHDEHIGYHTWVWCKPPKDGCAGEYWESTNPFKDLFVAGGGAAVVYEKLDEDFKSKGIFVNVVLAEGKGVEDRYRSRRLEWGPEGLAIVIETKKSGTWRLPFLPGDHVPADLLRKILVQKVPFDDAVWSGRSIGLAWAQGDKVKLRIIGKDGVK